MEQILELIKGSLAVSKPDLFSIVLSLLIATAVSLVISQVYKYTHRGLTFELSFMTTLVVLAPIVAIVMLFIRGDLVLSLGLIGSLSIIRFRTPIKDTRDMVFLFWVIATGLGCGTYNWTIVIIATIIITIIMFLLHFIKYGQSSNVDFVLAISGKSDYITNDIYQIVQKYTKDNQVRSKETEQDFWEVIFEVRFDKISGTITDELIRELRKIQGVEKVSLLAPQIALPV
ncbi:DUF4956 domain-containing protein [Alkalitalea saponilacus]|uniref:Uncharacterized membrane protein YhiD, involved in acid resistance n=1 Tax=Alkalitalea saponilacus TaxID=889453 RepID=A0A1T5H051_9BACT|nr:DUF4956 domain-containing protein [Alkalitalea saponilacus]ASB50961.1 DUF4956 domain-containing protein [Alkalitalea saponilacus]SKC13949.1 Uncharacterized membrane protein YhiD, involved in acid resistance [Alkalitalea saponilacus]